MRLLLLASLALGCAAAPQHQYERGTLTSPPPAAVRPGVGLPQPGQPGAKTDGPPRSPHARVLPATKEPGVWAVDHVRAPEKWPREPSILGIRLPFPPDAKTDSDKYQARKCGYFMHALAESSASAADLAKMQPSVKACLAARLYEQCMNTVHLSYSRKLDPRLKQEDFERRIIATKKTAKLFRQTQCSGDMPPDPLAEDIFATATLSYTAAMGQTAHE